MKTLQTPKDNNDEIARENIQKRLDNLYSKQELPWHASIQSLTTLIMSRVSSRKKGN